MIAFFVRRTILALVTVVLISIISFGIVVAPPGDFATVYADRVNYRLGFTRGGEAYQQLEAEIRARFNLDRPVYVQYWKWAWDLLHGDMGISMTEERPVKEIIGERLLMTLIVSGTTILITWMMALPIGIYAAVRQHSFEDYALTFVGFIGLATPDFLLALLMLWIMFDKFDVLLDGLFSTEYLGEPWSLGKVWDLMNHMWIPAIVLGTSGTAGLIRIMRNNLLDELRKPYVVTARAKGVAEWRLVLKYPVRVALNPFLSGIGGTLPALISGSAIVSIVLNLPTLGPTVLDSVLAEDMFVAASAILWTSVLTVVGVMISDVVLAIADPRIKMVDQ